jgi:hypothetical protein
MYNKPTGCGTPAFGAPHNQTNVMTLKVIAAVGGRCVVSSVVLPTNSEPRGFVINFTIHETARITLLSTVGAHQNGHDSFMKAAYGFNVKL